METKKNKGIFCGNNFVYGVKVLNENANLVNIKGDCSVATSSGGLFMPALIFGAILPK